jgi:hypothetical protein
MSRAVDAAQPFEHFTAIKKKQRNRLRARGRQLGDLAPPGKTQALHRLTQELAYQYWHRMLFARFLAENHLLMHPDGVAVSLEECDELAPAAQPPALNGFALAARYASRMLPQIFRTDDVLLEIEFAPEQRLALEKLLAGLPRETFLADDSLGWVYQFWQTKRKEEVNKSGEKIDARTLPIVTQLFTEHYMVQFLLHNTIGAWWCANNNIQPRMEHGLNTDEKTILRSGIDPCSIRVSSVALPALEYLRWREDGTPAAGTFDGWPKTLREFTLLDPCCGSGHFLVSAFHLLVPLRMHAEGLSARAAADAVLRDNLFGLEIDPRCTQIAAFALALAAWKFPGENGEPLGYRPLPPLNIACTGIAPQASEEQWLRSVGQAFQPDRPPGLRSLLAYEPIRNGLANLHALFSEAPTVGSLIDPNRLSADLVTADYETLKPYLDAALTAERTDDDARERAVAAAGMVKAAELLAREYTLVATNGPYLGRGKQHDTLKRYCEKNYPDAKADLATCFVERSLTFCAAGGTAALVTPQNWLFLGTYKKLRARLLQNVSWNVVARLGPRAFDTISGEVVNVALLTPTQQPPSSEQVFAGLEASEQKSAAEKATALCEKPAVLVGQQGQLGNPDAALSIEERGAAARLNAYANSYRGQCPGDALRFEFRFWEVFDYGTWAFLQSAPQHLKSSTGRESVVLWEGGHGTLMRVAGELRRVEGHSGIRSTRGDEAWGKRGVVFMQMRELTPTLYTGEIFDGSCAAVIPKSSEHVLALWAFSSSPEYSREVRKLNQKVNVENGFLVKVPFDLAHWQKVAAEKYPDGLPKPYSSDPTQWLFNGHPAESDDPLQVAVARLLGYRWPRQTGSTFPDCPALGDRRAGAAGRQGRHRLHSGRARPKTGGRARAGIVATGISATDGTRIKHGQIRSVFNPCSIGGS